MSQDREQEDLEHLADHVGRYRSRRRPPKPIADLVGQLLARHGYAQAMVSAELQEAWRAAAGATLGRDSRPARLQRGVLEVVVRSSAVLQELTFQKQRLLRLLQKQDVGQTIRDLRWRVGQVD